MATYGGFAAAPFMYYWYKFLDARLPGVNSKVILLKVVVDQVVAGFTLLNIFYVCTNRENSFIQYIHNNIIVYWCKSGITNKSPLP